jgi:hypothetical protein
MHDHPIATPLRHLPDDFAPLTEPVWLVPVGSKSGFEAPAAAKQSSRALRNYMREVALTIGGEWRAFTERGELLAVFSVGELFEEMTHKKIITLSYEDEVALWIAKRRLKLH